MGFWKNLKTIVGSTASALDEGMTALANGAKSMEEATKKFNLEAGIKRSSRMFDLLVGHEKGVAEVEKAYHELVDYTKELDEVSDPEVKSENERLRVEYFSRLSKYKLKKSG